MADDITPKSSPITENISDSSTESFGELFAEFERTHPREITGDKKQIEATVVKIDTDNVYLDIGFKNEGVLLRSAFEDNAEKLATGDKVSVSVKGRNPEGYYELSRLQVKQIEDWSS